MFRGWVKLAPMRRDALNRAFVWGWVLALAALISSGCSELLPQRSAGEKLYRKHCIDCHGIDGGGQTIRSMGEPFANLLDDSWRHAGDAAGIENVINQGMVFDHPTFDKLEPSQTKQIATYILQLRGERR